MKPNLFIVGAPKCGTTAWADYIGSHPDVQFCKIKEPHYFCSDLNHRHVLCEDEYLALFDTVEQPKVLGEASVWYLYSTEAAANIRKFNSAAKILIFLRDQEDAIPSLHNQLIASTYECFYDLEEAWRLSGERNRHNTGRSCKEPKLLDYKSYGRFNQQIERYFSQFPESQIRVFHFDDWSRNPRETYLEILRFLELPDDGRTEFTPVNEANNRRSRWIAEFLVNPPPRLRALWSSRTERTRNWLRQIVARIVRLNTRKGYVTRVNETIRTEIRAYYAVENALLQHRIWRPHSETGEPASMQNHYS